MAATIAAVATPEGEGSIGVVRLSGENAVKIADKIFKARSGKRLSQLKGYSALFGDVWTENEIIDQAVALVFKAPMSFTGEDVVEISCHGGEFVVNKVLRLALDNGAALAQRGEFSRRAFINGKIDLSQAEAIMDIISADNEQALRASSEALSGAVSKKCLEIKDDLTFAAATIAAFSDFPDEEPEFSGIDKLGDMLKKANAELQKLIDDYDKGRIIKNGIKTVIIGPPNAGKSTLMNLLSGYDRSIVTEIAGTTRDVIEESINFGGIRLRLFDTAGIHKTDDAVEKIGVGRTLEHISSADLVLLLLDSTGDVLAQASEILKNADNKNIIIVLNKSDIKVAALDAKEYPNIPKVSISAKEGTGLEELLAEIKKVVNLENLSGKSAVYLNERQRNCAIRALEASKEAKAALESGVTMDAVGVCLDDALAALMEITGERVTVEVANKVFEHFCVGK